MIGSIQLVIFKSFSKIKIYELTINLARGKSLRTKRKKCQCLFQPLCGQERGQFDLSNLDIVGSTKVYQERQLFL